MSLNFTIPAGIAKLLGYTPTRGEGGNLQPVDTGEPVRKLSKDVVARLLAANPHLATQPIGGKSRAGTDNGTTYLDYCKSLLAASDRQGFLTMGDFAKAANVTQVLATGPNDFDTFTRCLIRDGRCTVAIRGKKKKISTLTTSVAEVKDTDVASMLDLL